MARTEASIKAFMIATQLKKQHFKSTPIGLDIDAELSCKDDLKGWSQAELDTLGDYRLFANTIVAKIEDGTDAVVEVAYALLHNMDECDVWNEFKCEYEETPVDDHIHVFCTLSKGVTITGIAAAIGIEPNMIEKPKRGCKAIDNMTAYIIHAKDAHKFQYDPHDVCTVRGESYVDVWRKRKKAWDKGRSQKTAKRNVEDVRWLIDKARFGQVTIDQVIATPEYYEIYSLPENTPKIDAAFDAWERKCMRETVLAMERHEFSTTVLFVYGVEGVGKTILVRALNKYWRSVYGWDIANLAAKNSMDDYRAQEVIWLDDVTGSAMSAGDWLKLLDPENANNISARYRNKGQIAPKVIIINSNMRPLEFFYFAKEVGGGERSELMGRFFPQIDVVRDRPKSLGYWRRKLFATASR